MFGFGVQRARKAQLEVGVLLRRLLNTSDPRVSQAIEESRSASRCLRCLPVFVVPCGEGSQPLADHAAFGTTKEVSDHGMALVLPIQVPELEVVIGLLADQEPRFLRGQVKHCTAMGGGYWHVGVQAFEILDSSDPALQSLVPLTQYLVPSAMTPDLKELWEADAR